jgi:hypothetical protein
VIGMKHHQSLNLPCLQLVERDGCCPRPVGMDESKPGATGPWCYQAQRQRGLLDKSRMVMGRKEKQSARMQLLAFDAFWLGSIMMA